MTGQVTNHQPVLTKIGRSEDLFFSHVYIHTNNALAEMLNNKVKARLNDIIIKNNEMFGFNYYQQNPHEEKILLESRKGYCGECCDEVLKHVNNNDYKKVNPTKEHFFVLSKDQAEIIEPSYKQMFFKANVLEIEFDKTNEILKIFPDVFVGNKNDFNDMIMLICDILSISKPDTLQYWNISDTMCQSDDKCIFRTESISKSGSIIYQTHFV